mmetsp:Transcript_56292/g.131911  ORF Transcript_56292/g.131911 Transcript_56292/m.131911 type:complete len:86 (+) Transcript_56292:2287-2544(+)
MDGMEFMRKTLVALCARFLAALVAVSGFTLLDLGETSVVLGDARALADVPACLRTLWGETTRSGCAATGAATKLGEFEEDVNATT